MQRCRWAVAACRPLLCSTALGSRAASRRDGYAGSSQILPPPSLLQHVCCPEHTRTACPSLQAFIEWVPLRGASHDKIDLAACHRTFQFGDLATLVG